MVSKCEHTHTGRTKKCWREAEEEVNFDPAGHSKAEVIAVLEPACVCVCVLHCCLYDWVGVETTGVWPLVSYPQGWIGCLPLCVFVCVDHLVGTVANFSIRHTHTRFSLRPERSRPILSLLFPGPSGSLSLLRQM